MQKVRSLNSQLKTFFWIFGISMVFCPLIGLVLLDMGYHPVIGCTVLFFPVAQLALMLAIAVEDLIDMKRISQGKKSITPLNNLLFPQTLYIKKLLDGGHVKEAVEYTEAWLEFGKYSKEN